MRATGKVVITDSPWFWVLLFSLIGIAAVVTISGQYGKRQARLERQYQAREPLMDETGGHPSPREYSSAEDTLIAIWPLAVVLAGIAAVAAFMLAREQRGRRPVNSQAKEEPA